MRLERRSGDRRRPGRGRGSRGRDAFAVLLVLAVAGLAAGRVLQTRGWRSVPLVGADAGCDERIQTRLFFGMERPAGRVSEDEWNAFLAEEITPRFPDGLTVTDAVGQWRPAGRPGAVVREPSRVVEIVHGDKSSAAGEVGRIAARYKARYGQESVMVSRVLLDVCFE